VAATNGGLDEAFGQMDKSLGHWQGINWWLHRHLGASWLSWPSQQGQACVGF